MGGWLMRYWKHGQGRGGRTPEPDDDIERGVLAVVILMALVLFAIGIGTVAEMLSAGGPP